jgi:hypothetical protein
MAAHSKFNYRASSHAVGNRGQTSLASLCQLFAQGYRSGRRLSRPLSEGIALARAGHGGFGKPICGICLSPQRTNDIFAGAPAAMSGSNVNMAICSGIDKLRLPRAAQFASPIVAHEWIICACNHDSMEGKLTARDRREASGRTQRATAGFNIGWGDKHGRGNREGRTPRGEVRNKNAAEAVRNQYRPGPGFSALLQSR